jgi:hypothetical protein
VLVDGQTWSYCYQFALSFKNNLLDEKVVIDKIACSNWQYLGM